MCDRKRFFAETPKPKIVAGKCRNSAVTEISAVRELSAENGYFGRKLMVWAKYFSLGTNSLIKYRYQGTLLDQPAELRMMEELKFGQNRQLLAEMAIFRRKFYFGRMTETRQ